MHGMNCWPMPFFTGKTDYKSTSTPGSGSSKSRYSAVENGMSRDDHHYDHSDVDESGEPKTSSSNYAYENIDRLSIELSLFLIPDENFGYGWQGDVLGAPIYYRKQLRSPTSVMKELEKRLEIQHILIGKLQEERKQSRRYKFMHMASTQTDGLNNKESFSQETQTDEEEKSFVTFSSLEMENLKLHEENFRLSDEVQELKRQLAALQIPSQHSLTIVRKTVCVDLYSPGGSSIIESIEDSFKKELQTKLHRKRIDLTYNLIHAHEQNQLREPSIVLCPSFSRLGTDVRSVFSAIQDCGRGTVLVVIHYKDEHSLNKVKSEQMLSSEYSHLSAILDMAYFSKKGFYDCQFNRNTFEELSAFLINFAA
ncbi:hypothetical protein LOTGIDRAFT_239144 [Lottia gigantea]|uniref:Uncharacterized protein n=1 Tax=Lottia gigantea TaxID=225164 RepID=V4A2B6_LOTGI|nr:hypothetical protein LOTGIDRAFT_239144 [Lottia gigantea]ESO97988.1 hypothetical protein LOTGIDRAFT_239144 [Lottia gigantea]